MKWVDDPKWNHWQSHGWSNYEQMGDRALQAVRDIIEPGQKVYELGVGGGAAVVPLLLAGYEVWGTDILQTNIDETERQCAQHAVRFRHGIPETADLAICINVTQHMTRLEVFALFKHLHLAPRAIVTFRVGGGIDSEPPRLVDMLDWRPEQFEAAAYEHGWLVERVDDVGAERWARLRRRAI